MAGCLDPDAGAVITRQMKTVHTDLVGAYRGALHATQGPDSGGNPSAHPISLPSTSLYLDAVVSQARLLRAGAGCPVRWCPACVHACSS